MNFKGLVLGGGAVYGFIYLGGLKYLYENGIDIYNLHLAGSSIGAIISSLIAINIPIDDIINYLKTNKCVDEKDINIWKLWKNNGIDNGDTLRKSLYYFLKDITFSQLYKEYNKILLITSFNVTTMQTDYFSYKHNPDVKLIDAVLLSSALPIIFETPIYNGCRYIDGCFQEPLPVKELSKLIASTEIITMHIKYTFSDSNETDYNFLTFIFKLARFLMKKTNLNLNLEYDIYYTVIVNMKTVDIYRYLEHIDEFVDLGYNHTKENFKHLK